MVWGGERVESWLGVDALKVGFGDDHSGYCRVGYQVCSKVKGKGHWDHA